MGALSLAWSVASTCMAIGCTSVADYPYMKEGQPHAEAIVAAVAGDWKPDELIKNADPKMLEVATEAGIKEAVESASRAVGPVKTQSTLMGSTGVAADVQGRFASYVIEVHGEKSVAKVKINIHKAGTSWTVLGFWVDWPRPSAAPSPS